SESMTTMTQPMTVGRRVWLKLVTVIGLELVTIGLPAWNGQCTLAAMPRPEGADETVKSQGPSEAKAEQKDLQKPKEDLEERINKLEVLLKEFKKEVEVSKQQSKTSKRALSPPPVDPGSAPPDAAKKLSDLAKSQNLSYPSYPGQLLR